MNKCVAPWTFDLVFVAADVVEMALGMSDCCVEMGTFIDDLKDVSKDSWGMITAEALLGTWTEACVLFIGM